MALLAVLAICGFAVILVGIVLVPFVLLFKLVGGGLKIAFSAIGLLFASIFVLPVAVVIGGLLLLKVTLLLMPLLLLALMVWGLVTLIGRRPAAV